MGRRVEAHGGADENATEGFVQPGIRGCYIGCPGSCRDWPRGETVRSLASNRREPHGFCIHRSSGACRQPALPCSFRGSNPRATARRSPACRADNMRWPETNLLAKCTPSGRSLWPRSEEHTSELQSLMRISYAVFCLKKKK